MDDGQRRNKNTIYKNEYITRAYDQLKVCSKKDLRLPERIQHQIDIGNAASKQSYIIDAVLKQLEQDENE